MRSSWLYFATRSVRLAEPVLICPALVATARSAIVASSVSPDPWEITPVEPGVRAMSPARGGLRVRDEHVVADELHAVAERACQRLPAVPVPLGEPVLD